MVASVLDFDASAPLPGTDLLINLFSTFHLAAKSKASLNLSSLGIQIGVLSALAPTQAKVIARIAPSAMICGFISYVALAISEV